jgi:hypothetical protein
MRATAAFLSVTAGLSVIFQTAFAQQTSSSSAARDTAYHVLSAQTFVKHAKEHSHILNRYSAGSPSVPQEVVQEQTGAISNNLASARKAFGKLKAASNNNPDVAAKIADVEKQLGQVEQSITQLREASDAAARSQAARTHQEMQDLLRLTNDLYDRVEQQDEVRQQLRKMWKTED